MGSINSIKVNGVEYDVKETHYATCGSGPSAEVKYADVINGPFSLAPGVRVIVKFTRANSVSGISLGVNSTSPKDVQTVKWKGAAPTAETLWSAGSLVEFVYDGTYW